MSNRLNQEREKKIIEAYEKYIKFLDLAYNPSFQIAVIHGYKTDIKIVNRGKRLRNKIAKLKKTLNHNPCNQP